MKPPVEIVVINVLVAFALQVLSEKWRYSDGTMSVQGAMCKLLALTFWIIAVVGLLAVIFNS